VQLYGSNTSPYARKIRVSAIELGVMDRITFTVFDVGTIQPDLLKLNPLHKVPVLVTDDGRTLFDSPVIAEWLDATYGPRLLPASGPARWSVLQTAALADGILDAAIPARAERLRPAEQRSDAVIEKQLGKIARALDWLEQNDSWHAAAPDLGQIGVGCAIGYLEFRLPDLAVLSSRPRLAAWHAGFSERPAMKATVPH
jgi:glutathione S-transferase